MIHHLCRDFLLQNIYKTTGLSFLQNLFHEKVPGRIINQFGNIAQLFTTYEFTAGITPPIHKRGINSAELFKEKSRWFIMSFTRDEAGKEQPITPSYLNK